MSVLTSGILQSDWMSTSNWFVSDIDLWIQLPSGGKVDLIAMELEGKFLTYGLLGLLFLFI